MQDANDLKEIVRKKYSELALQDKSSPNASCCGSDPCGVNNIMSDSYDKLAGYEEEADLGLGCGLPTEFAMIQTGDTVLDLGAGAGNDCFVARAETGPTGKVIGVDFTPAMVQRARQNAKKLGFDNVEFYEGDIEDLPIADNTIDVVVSNCVLNLVPDKAKVFGEVFRVLRPGGHFSISDIVVRGDIPSSLRTAAEEYAGCVAGAMQMDPYLDLVHQAGFTDVKVQKQKPIVLPKELLQNHLSPSEIHTFGEAGLGIFSLTVYAKKPDHS